MNWITCCLSRRTVLSVRVGLALMLAGMVSGTAQSQDLSEALRLWKFTYKLELDAYGVQYMSKDLLRKAGEQLESAAGQTMVTNSQMIVCIEASHQLAAYYKLAATSEPAPQARRKIRADYESARAGCLRLLSADPAEYPLGWPE